jgi:hypothetical protein
MAESDDPGQTPDAEALPDTADLLADADEAGTSSIIRVSGSWRSRPPVDPTRDYAPVRWSFDDMAESTFDFVAVDMAGRKKPVPGFHVEGTCPVCQHSTFSLFPLMSVVTGSAAELVGVTGGVGALDYIERPMTALTPRPEQTHQLTFASIHCNCTEFHNDAHGAFGCGASWLVAAELDLEADKQAENPEILPVAADDANKYWPAAEALATAAPKELTAFRTTGAAWQTGFVTVLAIAGVSGLLAGRETIQKLSSPWGGIIIVLAAIAAVLSATNIILALSATVGFPELRTTSVGSTLAEADLAPTTTAIASAKQLKWSVAAGAASFVIALGAIIATLALPDATPKDTKVAVTVIGTDGKPSTTCAVLPSAQPTATAPPGSINVKQSGAPSPTSIALPSVVALAPC